MSAALSLSTQAFPAMPTNSPRQRIITLRAKQFAGPEPQRDDYLLSRSAETAWRILAVTKLRLAGAGPGQHKLRLTCRVLTEADLPIPNGSTVHQWPAQPAPTRPARPRTRHTADPGPTEAYRDRMARITAKAPLLLAEALKPVAELRDSLRADTARRAARWHDGSPLIPAARLEAVTVGKHKLRGPTAISATWRDPDDVNPNRRRPREIQGHRTHDQVRTLYRRNPGTFRAEHVVAADLYRLAWEMGPGLARPGYERSMIPAQGFGPGSGPDDARMASLAAWDRVQAYVGDRDALRTLDLVVLRNADLTTLAASIGLQRRKAADYLATILDRLLAYYGEEVADVLRQEAPSD